MIDKIRKLIIENKETLIAILAILSLVAILGLIFKDAIEIVLVLLFIVGLMNLDNISTYVRQKMAEKSQQQAATVEKNQIIHDILTDVIFHGLTGNLGKIIGAIPPGTVLDVFPANIPPIQTVNGVTTHRFTFSRTPGSQPLAEDVMKRIANSHLKKSASGLIPPKPGSTFWPYFYTVAVTSDTSLPDTIILHIVYVDDLLVDNYIENLIREEAEEHRRKLVDTQPPDDEDF